MDLGRQLQTYAELAVRVALNLQPGQRLMIIGPLANGGASLESAPLAREIAAAAYRAGSPLVETIYGDEGSSRCDSSTPRATRSAIFRRGCPGALRARRGRPCGAVDQRERSRSPAGRAARFGERAAAGDCARGAAVPRADLAQRDQLGDRRGSKRGWAEKIFPASPEPKPSRACGTPSRACAVSTHRIPSQHGKRISGTFPRAAIT